MPPTYSKFEPSHSQRERLCFAESTLLWEGEIQRSRVSDVFGVVLNHVTKDFREYEAAFPRSLTFEPRRRVYVPGPAFKPRFASGDPHEYLALQLVSSQIKSSALVSILGDQFRVQGIPTPAHGIKRQSLSLVVQAIKSATALDVVYHSMTSPEPVKRQIWPHALVHTGSWWHLRAFDSRSAEFRNFALQRIEQPRALAVRSPQLPDKDREWQLEAMLEVIPHTSLNKHQKEVVARDFGMTSDQGGPIWRIKIRNCLVGYFAAYYGLDLPNARPPRHVLMLRNREELAPLFFPSDPE